MNRKVIILLVLLVIFIIGGISYYYYYFKKENLIPNQSTIIEKSQQEAKHPPCLAENEWAITNFHENLYQRSDFRRYPVKIIIMPKDSTFTSSSTFEFSVEGIDARNAGRPSMGVDIKKCGIYIHRHFNYSFEWLRPSVNEPPYPNEPPVIKIIPGYKSEIWKYDYSGKGNPILLINKMDKEGVFYPYFTGEFAIDQAKTYITLIKGWYGEPENHALVIKNLKTMEDKYVVTLKELMEKYPDVEPATISLYYWGQERFGTGNIFNFHLLNSERTGFNINVKTGELEIFRYEY